MSPKIYPKSAKKQSVALKADGLISGRKKELLAELQQQNSQFQKLKAQKDKGWNKHRLQKLKARLDKLQKLKDSCLSSRKKLMVIYEDDDTPGTAELNAYVKIFDDFGYIAQRLVSIMEPMHQEIEEKDMAQEEQASDNY